MINLDRFGGVTEPDDGVYFLTREQEAEAREADRLAEIEDLRSEIEDREAELKEMHARLEELLEAVLDERVENEHDALVGFLERTGVS